MATAEAVRETRPIQIDFPGLEIGPSDTVVDVGCGDGSVCVYAGDQGAKVIGLDIDPDCIALSDAAMVGVPARSWKSILSDCDPIPLPDAVATVVVCTEVLEHVDDPVRLTAELERIGRPGARYVIAVPDPASESLMREVAPDWYWKPPYHRRVFEHAQLEALLRQSGLRVDARYQGGSYWSLWWAFRMASGATEPYAPTPDSELLRHWESLWNTLADSTEGNRLAKALDRLVPKSQIVIATKPGGILNFSRGMRYRLQRLKEGAVQIAGLEFRWSLRRARTH